MNEGHSTFLEKATISAGTLRFHRRADWNSVSSINAGIIFHSVI